MERGFAGASLRAVTREAGVNLAAVNYHFGSKEELLREIFRRHLGPINKRRLELLDALESSCGKDKVRVEQVLETLLRPMLEHEDRRTGGVPVRALVARLVAEPRDVLHPVLKQEFAEVARRYFTALREALPELPMPELLWRLQFVVGVMNHVVSEEVSKQIDLGRRPPADTLQRMVAFLGAGMRTEPPDGLEKAAE